MKTKSRIALFLLAGIFSTLETKADTERRVAISNEQPFLDHISMNPKTQENDLIVKFAFNEEENSLTVSLISYRNLFVFEDNTRFRKMTPWYSRKFNPDKLNYPVDAEGASGYAFSLELFHRIKKEKGEKYVFKPWISYTGMQIQPTEYRMINDYIEQKFDINKGGQMVTIHLHDVLVMDEQVVNKKRKYLFVDHTDLNKYYVVEIRRNPCFKKEEEIELEKMKMETVQKIYESLNNQFLSDTVAVMEGGKEMFEEQRILTLKQNPKEPIISDCPDIQMYAEMYNSYIDSIASLVCEEEQVEIQPEYFLAMAKQIDLNVAKWQNITDASEKSDLIRSSLQIIDEVEEKLSERNYLSTSEVRYAIAIYRNAESYFRKECARGIEDHERRKM